MNPDENGHAPSGLVPKQPVPMNVNLDAVHDEQGQGFLVLTFNTPDVTFVGFIPGDHAVKFAHDTQIKANQAAKPGIVMPGPQGIVKPE